MFKLVVNYFHSIEKLDEKRVYCLWFMYDCMRVLPLQISAFLYFYYHLCTE